MTAVFPALDPASYTPHGLHDLGRIWPETNCYVDLWIEVVAAFGSVPEAMFGFALTQDYEGDQFTFFKIPFEDLESLYGIRSQELAIFDDVASHAETQIARGRLPLFELDSFYLPDTVATTYRAEHGKTTVAINRIDRAGRRMDYFHNGGFFRLEGKDYTGIFHIDDPQDGPPFLPYAEFARFPETPLPSERHLRGEARRLLARHFARRPQQNPILAFAAVFPAQVEAVAVRPFAHFHKYAFNTLRQLGANFELLAAHLDWLSPDGLAEEKAAALTIAEQAKTVQFQLARAVARRKFEQLGAALAPSAEAWDILMDGLGRELG